MFYLRWLYVVFWPPFLWYRNDKTVFLIVFLLFSLTNIAIFFIHFLILFSNSISTLLVMSKYLSFKCRSTILNHQNWNESVIKYAIYFIGHFLNIIFYCHFSGTGDVESSFFRGLCMLLKCNQICHFLNYVTSDAVWRT